MSNRPLIPVDNTGMDEIADELINYKPKEKPKVEEIKEEPAQPTVQQQAKKVKRKFAFKAAGIITGVSVGLAGFIYGIIRISWESLDRTYPRFYGVTQYATTGFWFNEHSLDLNDDGSMKMVLDYETDEAYTMLNLPNNTLVDRVMSGGKVYERGSVPEGIFAEADAKWNEYIGEFDIPEMKKQWEAYKQKIEAERILESGRNGQ